MSKRVVIALAIAGLLGSGCSALKDPEPWTVTITYEDGPGGTLVVAPLRIDADAAFGEIQVVNNSNRKHGFEVEELAVFETIPAGKSKQIPIQEAKNRKKYAYDCHLHPNEYSGTIEVNYVAEEER